MLNPNPRLSHAHCRPHQLRATPRHAAPRRAALPDKPRKVSVSINRTAADLWHTSMPMEDLDYLFALEFERQRQRQLADIARRDLFLERGVGQMKRPSLKKKKL